MKAKILILLLLLSVLFLTGMNRDDTTAGLVQHKEDGTLTCDTSGIAYIPSTQAYGEWTFDFYKDSETSTLYVKFISPDHDLISWAGDWTFSVTASEHIYLFESGNLRMATVASYIDIDTQYSIKITRNSTPGEFGAGVVGTFYLYAKSNGKIGTAYPSGSSSWIKVDLTGGLGINPLTNNINITSNYFVLDFDATDKIRNIHTTDGNLDVRDFTVSTGAYTTSGTYFSDATIQHPLHTGLVLDMPMTLPNIRGATTALDISANTNHGTASGNPVIGATYTAFDGFGDWLTLASEIAFADDTAWTISFWINPNVASSTISLMGDKVSAGEYWRIFGSTASDYIRIYGIDNASASWNHTWVAGCQHWTFTCDGTSSSNLEAFKNNVSLGTKTLTNSEVVLRVIGQLGDDTNVYIGNMAHTRIWNRVLTTAERTQEYNRLKNTYQS